MSFWDILLSIGGALLVSALLGFFIGGIIIVAVFLISHKEMPASSFQRAIVIICFVCSFVFLGAREWYGDHQIGSFLECREYQDELYKGHLYPDYSSIKNYDVVILLDREKGDYYADKVYFNKEQYLTVYSWIEPLEVNQQIWIEDQNGREWYLELTDQRINYIPD